MPRVFHLFPPRELARGVAIAGVAAEGFGAVIIEVLEKVAHNLGDRGPAPSEDWQDVLLAASRCEIVCAGRQLRQRLRCVVVKRPPRAR
mmetsp:Transcript_14085/g.38543  ORF Transcript_14085/g.38543 Transcript_14085/m.38543 type:complete len:89 (-) Transcript_14085:36-302(-)